MPTNNQNKNIFRVTFFSGVGSVTGANFMLEVGEVSIGTPLRLLVDCGLAQGDSTSAEENRQPFMYDPKTVDYLFLTHAHLDHVGRIPKLVKDGFRGTIYSTPETLALARLILADAVGILGREAQESGTKPIYGIDDVATTFTLWKTIPYHVDTKVGEGKLAQGHALSVVLKDAGHVLGSSMYQFTYTDSAGEKKNIVFTGDLGNSPTPLLRDTEDIPGAEYIVMESVYGDRNHEPKELRRQKLMEIINDTLKKNGTVLIPAFSIERTQVILYEINELVEKGLIPSVPVFVDSPLAIKVTQIYETSTNLFNDTVQAEIRSGENVFNFPKLQFTLTNDESKTIDHTKPQKIIIAGSGMSTGGRVRHHETLYLSDPKNSVIFVGYQAPGTLGRQISDGAKKVNISGVDIDIKARIENILGYSSHKDSDHLVQFVGTAGQSLKKDFVVMGEPKSAAFLAQRLRNELSVDAVCPERGVPYDL
jgi:metallo-beta-lactamase family protein